jgi:hypothetical protein
MNQTRSPIKCVFPRRKLSLQNPLGSELPNRFLEDCRKCIDREDVDSRVIDFDALHMDIILNRFNTQLPAIFHMMDNREENKPKGRKKKKQKSKEKEEG